MLTVAGRRICFAGDSAYDETLFKEIGRRMGPPDLALVPIGAYEPRWFMKGAHANPAEAVQIHRDLGAKRSVADALGHLPADRRGSGTAHRGPRSGQN